jgi:hypothetical protein
MKLKKKDKKRIQFKEKKRWTQQVNFEIFQLDSLPITSLE